VRSSIWFDTSWGKEITSLIKREFIPTPRAWLDGAPEALLTKLAARIRE
jgi:hypothetical protein